MRIINIGILIKPLFRGIKIIMLKQIVNPINTLFAQLNPLLLTATMTACSLPVFAQQETLETMEVTGSANGLPINDIYRLEERLGAVPGGTNLIETSDKPSMVTLTDALGNQPGIIVQEFFGGLDQPRLNIRGSGLQGNPVSRGVLIRENNLPINEADGSFVMGTMDLRNAEAISVHRGANSRVPGAMTLGGDINFINDISGGNKNRVHAESGSFGQQAFLFNHQHQFNQLTYQLGFSEQSSTGYRHHSDSSKSNYLANATLQLAPNLFNQTHLRKTELHFDMPFVLTAEKAKSDPTSVYGDGDELFDIGMNIYKRDPHRTVKQTRLSNQTQLTLERSEHYFGVYYQATDDAFVDPMSHIETDSTLTGIHYTFDHFVTNYFHYQLGIDYNDSDMPRNYFGNHPLNGNRLKNYARFDLAATNTTIAAQFDLTLLPEWILNGQVQHTQSQRNGSKQQDGTAINETWNLLTPKLGIIYQPGHIDLRLFANISEAKEIPTYWEYIGTALNPVLTNLSQAFFQNLEPQEAITLEIGGKYKTEAIYSDFYFDDGIFSGNRIAGVPDHIISGELLYKGEYFMAGPSFYWVPTDNPVDHENTLDNAGFVSFGLRGTAKINDFFNVFLKLDNITNKNYNSTFVIRERSNPDLPTFLPGNGFSARLGFTLDFSG
ncbi:MAG: hypothetical protein CSA49_06615 [Gammaproteobacteria bacterium]|nr:MAG: hypothetical protein CSA49_06615 [Gammaproteobacteria bacterium]